MAAAGNFDLESRTGKAPGAFSYPLPVSHSSFIFMNAAGTYDDVVTLMHAVIPDGGICLAKVLANERLWWLSCR